MRKAVLALFAVLLLVAQAVTSSQSSVPPRSATDVTNADIRATIKMAPPDGIQDQQIRVVDMGKYNVAVGVLHRSAKPAQQGAIDHAQVTEVYHIIDGSGTFVTGGTIANGASILNSQLLTRVGGASAPTGATLLTDVADFHFSDIAVRGAAGARAIGANDDAAAVELPGRRRQHP